MFGDFQERILIWIVGLYSINSELVPINWNISNNRAYSNLERSYKYPMFNEVAPATCDLIENSCDVLCCHDSDCDEWQRQSYMCTKPSNICNEKLTRYDCNCPHTEKPEWFYLFCFVTSNPLYLGMFYKTPPKVETISTFKNLIGGKSDNFFKFKQQNEQNLRRRSSFNHYKYGSPIMTYTLTSDSMNFPSISPLMTKRAFKDSSYICVPSSVKYRINENTFCYTEITKELCENGQVLSILPYLVQDGIISSYENSPMVLKNLNFLESIEIEVIIKCSSNKFAIKKFRKQEHVYVFPYGKLEPCDNYLSSYSTIWSENTCQKVLTGVQYQFITNGSDIIKLKAEFILMNISFPIKNVKNNNRNVTYKYIYFKQNFNVTFFDMLSNNENQYSSEKDTLLNRGYFVGEELNYGYRSSNKSTVSWEKGELRILKSGWSCDESTQVTFGYDLFTVCYLRTKFSNCGQMRNFTEDKFNSLLKGDALASYKNLKSPYDDFVPVLRNYLNSSKIEASKYPNSTKCHVPIRQDILMQYTSVYTQRGHPVYRIIGLRIDRVYWNVTITADVPLTSRVIFLHVPSTEGVSLSRYWEEIFSPELSENAWWNIYKAFDDVTPSEQGEMNFWFVVLFICVLFLTFCTDMSLKFW